MNNAAFYARSIFLFLFCFVITATLTFSQNEDPTDDRSEKSIIHREVKNLKNLEGADLTRQLEKIMSSPLIEEEDYLSSHPLFEELFVINDHLQEAFVDLLDSPSKEIRHMAWGTYLQLTDSQSIDILIEKHNEWFPGQRPFWLCFHLGNPKTEKQWELLEACAQKWGLGGAAIALAATPGQRSHNILKNLKTNNDVFTEFDKACKEGLRIYQENPLGIVYSEDLDKSIKIVLPIIFNNVDDIHWRVVYDRLDQKAFVILQEVNEFYRAIFYKEYGKWVLKAFWYKGAFH